MKSDDVGLAVNVPETPRTVNFDNLIDDCKEMIIRHLDLSDLLNITDSSKQLHPIACQIFKAKSSGRKVAIDRFEFAHGNREWTTITNSLITLKLLRNFGHLISDLQINFALFDINLCEHIEQYLVKYSAKSLSFISFNCHPHKELFKNIKEPFTNAYSIEMRNCCFLRSKLAYNEFFPRLRYLQVDANRYECRSFINTNMPFVRSLAIFEDCEKDEIVNALKRNPQILKLLLVTNYNAQLIRNLNNYLPNLQCLCLRDLPKEFNADNFETIHLNNLLDLSVSYGPETLEKLPFNVSELQHLSIAGHLFLDTYWFRLLHNIQLQSIGLFDTRGDVNKLFRRISSHYAINVNVITISTTSSVSPSCIINFINRCNALKSITLTIGYQTDFDRFVGEISFKTSMLGSRHRILGYSQAQMIKFRVRN